MIKTNTIIELLNEIITNMTYAAHIIAGGYLDHDNPPAYEMHNHI